LIFPGNQGQFVLSKQLGKGAYGIVYLSHLKTNPEKLYAIKVMDRSKIKGKAQELLINEIGIMADLKHRNVCKLVSATKTESNYYLVTEFCNGGDLSGFMKARGGYLEELEARLLLRQLVRGMAAIQRENIMHRDLKLPNILLHFPELTRDQICSEQFSIQSFTSEVEITGEHAVKVVVKIADLGFARRLAPDDLAKTTCGTPLNMAPEVLEGHEYDLTADVWSLGCVFYEMLTGFSPFTGTNQRNLKHNLAKGSYQFPKTLRLSLLGLDFINQCLQYDSSKRPTLQQLLDHPYF